MKNNKSKFLEVKDFSKLIEQYLLLCKELTNIFNSNAKKYELSKEIALLEDVLKSKLTILSMMKGY